MKTKQLFFLTSLSVLLSITKSNAQATVASATNVVVAGNFLGSGATSNVDVTFKRNNVFAGMLATTTTAFGVNSKAIPNSVAIGVSAGQFASGTGNNTYVGQNAGKGTSATILNSGTGNTFIGLGSGQNNTSGSANAFLGTNAGIANGAGSNNVYIGSNAGLTEIGGGVIHILVMVLVPRVIILARAMYL